jgi:hypothetical protein
VPGLRAANRTAIVRRLAPLLFLAVLILGSTATARAQAVDAEDGFAARISQERAAAGLPGLVPSADLQTVARRHAQRMADRGTPFHNPNLGSEVTGWSLVGENVGYGPDVDTVHSKFMASADHRRIILMPELTEVGVGVVRTGDGLLWVVEVFRRPEAAPAPSPQTASATAVPATAAPTTAPPAAVVAPAPAPATAAPSPTTTVLAPPPTAPSADRPEVTLGERPTAVLGQIAVRPAVAPDLDLRSYEVPAVAWLAGLLLSAVVALQARVMRRLGLVPVRVPV